MDNMGKKRDRFVRIAGSRVNNILNTLDNLSKCSNKNNYDYSKEDITKMMAAIKEKVRTTEQSFSEELNRGIKNKFTF